jgi:homoserine O-acetyltransferase
MAALLTCRSRDSFENRFGRHPQIPPVLESSTGSPAAQSAALATVLATLPPRALVISIETDGLFTPSEQKELATHIPDAKLVVIPPPDDHDGFLLGFEQINLHVSRLLRREFPELYEKDEEVFTHGDFVMKKTSLFGEAEVDITRW